MNSLSDIGIPVVVWLMMLIVGLELTVADFKRVIKFPKAVLVATTSQIIAIPFCAFLLIWLLDPPFYIAAGIILVSASPGGAISNFYVLLARGNLALSVTLTSATTLIALATMPAISTLGFEYFLKDGSDIIVPVGRMILQLVIMLLLPILTGMTFRYFYTEWVSNHRQSTRRLSSIAIVLLISLILFEQRQNLSSDMWQVVTSALLFSGLVMSVGWGTGVLAKMTYTDRFTCLIEFGVRNLAITTIIGIMVFEQSSFALFAAVFFITQLVLVLILIKMFHFWNAKNSGAQ